MTSTESTASETVEVTETETDQPSESTPKPSETVEFWRDKARDQEKRAKENAAKAKDYDALKAQSMSETEKAVKAARDEGLAEGIRVGASKIAAAEIRAAATGRPVDVDALLEGVDTSRFIGADGEVDRVAVVGWVDKVAPMPEPSPENKAYFDLGQGARAGAGNVPALNSTQLERDLRDALKMH